MEIKVETRTDPWGDPEPLAFFIGRRRLEVRDVLDRWLAVEHAYYKVEADDDGQYILRLDSARGSWQLILFNSPQLAAR